MLLQLVYVIINYPVIIQKATPKIQDINTNYIISKLNILYI
jgi:hypothetical protein